MFVILQHKTQTIHHQARLTKKLAEFEVQRIFRSNPEYSPQDYLQEVVVQNCLSYYLNKTNELLYSIFPVREP